MIEFQCQLVICRGHIRVSYSTSQKYFLFIVPRQNQCQTFTSLSFHLKFKSVVGSFMKSVFNYFLPIICEAVG